MTLSVVVPCFNERANVERFPRELIPELESLGLRWELVGVDDGSSDGTAEALERLPGAVLVRHSRNQGLGTALRAGFASARGEWVVTLDADLTFPPRSIRDLLARQKETGADMVAGSPLLTAGGMSGVSWTRRLPSAALNAAYRALIDRRLTAYTGIFRLYRRTALEGLGLSSRGFEINAEAAALFCRRGLKVAETPVPLGTRELGQSKLDRWRELRAHAALLARLLATR